ncbi:MAG: hypothetical protein JWQ97_2151 [Phenylobacterium sp.]|nr:hypothetical protein [Phenylobacterium sp.]
MGVGTDGDDVLPGGSGNETLDGGAGNDTASYASSSRGVVANLGTGIAAYIPRVMPLGDSITYGSPEATTLGGYRGLLWSELTGNNLTIDFVGSGRVAGQFEDGENEGHPGYTITDVDAGVSGWLAASRPDIVLLIIGTNDTNKGATTPQQIADRLAHLIDDIAAQPDPPKILIGPIPPAIAQTDHRTAVIAAYNAMIPDVVAEKHAAGVDITFVDMSDLTSADMSAPPADSGVHPNASGYQKIATDWYNALLNLGADNGTLAGTPRDHLVSIENLEGSAYKDILTGDGGPNQLSGLGGNDILDGGGGADTLIGGRGNDVYVVDSLGDRVIEIAGEGTDTVKTAVPSYTLGANVENLTFTGAGAFQGTGNELANVITGGDGNDTLDGGNLRDTLIGGLGDDRLIGGGSADRMEGGPGNDTYVVDSSGDVVVETLSQANGGGIDTVESNSAYTLGANVENLTLTGTAVINGTGNDDANLITGNTRNNILDGRLGDDTIVGGPGADTITGGGGVDVFQASSAGELNGDLITDYGDGDRIVLKQSLASGANVLLDTSGANALLKIDGDNNGLFETVLTLQGTPSGQLHVTSGYGFDNNVITISTTSLSLAATDAVKAEGNSGSTAFTFTVTRSGGLSGATTADWAVTGSGAAPADAADFSGGLPSGHVSFAAGESSTNVTVNVAGDTVFEADEGFTVTLSNASGSALLTQATAHGAIVDDDATTFLSLAATDATKAEGNSGSTPFTFTATRSGDLSGATTADWAVTGSGAAPADAADFGGAAPSGHVSFAAGESSKVITVDVAADTVFESDEGFTVTLSNPSGSSGVTQAAAVGSITNDDSAPPSLSLAATDATKAEGNSGSTAFTFTVTRSGDLSGATTANWAVTGSGAAPADAADFGGTLPSGQVSFAAGESSQVITVNVAGDTAQEANEGFTVTLSNASGGAAISQATAAGSITNDDSNVPPAPSAPDLQDASDTGTSNTDNLTNDTTPTFVGTAATGTTVQLLEGSKQLGQVITGSTGAWSITASSLSAGSHVISATASSPVGGVGPPSDTVAIVIDTTPPSRPSTPDLPPELDTGRSNSDNITSDATPTLRGTAQAGSLVTLHDGSVDVGTAIADSSGAWSITTGGLPDGVHKLTAGATDDAANVSATSGLLTLTVDTTMIAPVITSATTTKLTGTAEPAAIVHIFDGATELGQVTAGNTGVWSLSKAFSNTPHAITVTADDRAGNSAAGAGQVLFGSSASDSLAGGPGDDSIIGFAGADTLAGGAGDDVFVFGAGFGKDVINGFVSGASSDDHIQLTRAMLGVGSGATAQAAFDALLAKTQDVAGDGVITIDSQNTITLTGVSKASLDVGDFIFT